MSITVTALKLADHLTDPWAAADAIRPALRAVLIRHRGRLLAVVHGPRDTLDVLVSAGLGTDFSADSRVRHGPYKTWERLADTPGAVTWADQGLVVEARLRYTDMWDLTVPEPGVAEDRIRAYLDAHQAAEPQR